MVGAVDIGGTKIAVGVVSPTGKVLSRRMAPSIRESTFAEGIDAIVKMLRETSVEANTKIEGVGVGCTGPVDPIRGTVGKIDFLPKWSGANFVEALRTRMGISAAIENDANAVALGEHAWGVGKGTQSFVFVTVGTGIGAGVILGGQLYRGVGGAHSEIGHHVLDPSGPRCFCGARGCWESLAAGPALVRWFKSQLSGNESLPGEVSARRICELARLGDDLAKRTIDRGAFYLGTGIANLVTLFAPEVIALGGGLMNGADLLLSRTAEIVRQNCGLVPNEETAIVLASLGSDAALAGAAQVWHGRFH